MNIYGQYHFVKNHMLKNFLLFLFQKNNLNQLLFLLILNIEKYLHNILLKMIYIYFLHMFYMVYYIYLVQRNNLEKIFLNMLMENGAIGLLPTT